MADKIEEVYKARGVVKGRALRYMACLETDFIVAHKVPNAKSKKLVESVVSDV